MGATGALPSSRRQWLLGAGASLAGLAAAQRALARPAPVARPDPLSQLLREMPPELRALIPPQVFEAGQFVSSLMALEGEVKALKLPPSKLDFRGAPLSANLDNLYELAMPRLVALIDRTELRNLGLADQAGGLLAKLHRTQYSLPALFGEAQAPARSAGAVRFLIEPEGAPPGEPAQPALPGIEAPPLELPDAQLPPLDLPPVAQQPTGPAGPIAIRRSVRFADLADEYLAMFKAAQPLPEHKDSTDWHLAMMRENRPRYETAGKRNGVPWYFLAAIHGLEASFNFRGHLHNGDAPLSQRTRDVPAGRPLVWLPPSDWESSAADALRLMGFAQASDWSLARTLFRLEAYNGFGYRRIGRATPYLWSFSSNYTSGKFVADGRFSAAARSHQCGAATMLKLLGDAGEIQLA